MNSTQIEATLGRSPLFYDTETTGLAGNDQVVEISVVGYDSKNGQTQLLMDTLVRATKPISQDAMRVHHITPAETRSAPGIAALQAWLKRAFTSGRPVGAWNVAFDKRLIKQSLEANGLDARWLAEVEFFCAQQLYQRALGRSKPTRLETAVKETRIAPPPGRAHRALYDTHCALDVLKAVANQGRTAPAATTTGRPGLPV